jgi:hypothetical protein
LAGLTLPAPPGAPTSPLKASIAHKTYCFPANDAQIEMLRLEFGAGADTLRVRTAQQEYAIPFGLGGARVGSVTAFDAPVHRPEPRPVAATGAWQDENTFVLQLSYFETPFCTTLTCRFIAENRLQFDSRLNVSFGPTERPQIVGEVDD